MNQYSKILITGASSGLGRALAIKYASDGKILFLISRNQERLKEAAEICRNKGAIVYEKILDVTDQNAMVEAINDIYHNNFIELVIANAGISGGSSGAHESAEQVRSIFKTNLDGVLNTILPVMPHMVEKKSGHIVLISSLAGYRGLASCPAYSASKAAVRVLGEGLCGDLYSDNVKVSVVTPGYIKTPLTDVNKFPMPFIMSPDKAADIIMKGVAKNKSRISFPKLFYFFVWLLACLPVALTDIIVRNLPKK